jgi:hypothetical protein
MGTSAKWHFLCAFPHRVTVFTKRLFCMLQRQGIVPALRAGSEQSQVQNRRGRVPAPDRRDAGQRARLLDPVSRPQVLGPLLLGHHLRPPAVAAAGNGVAAFALFRRRKVKKSKKEKLNFLGRSDARAFVNGPSFNCGEKIIIPLVNESFTLFQMRLLFANCRGHNFLSAESRRCVKLKTLPTTTRLSFYNFCFI